MTRPIRTMLLIDDNEVDQMMYARVIRRSGLVDETIPFLAADLALDWLGQPDCPAVDMVVLDINMPRMDGFEFLEEAAKLAHPSLVGTVIVMLTTSLDPRDEKRAKDSPLVRDLFYKPLTADHLETMARYRQERPQS